MGSELRILHILIKSSYDGAAIVPLRIIQNLPQYKHTIVACFEGSASDEIGKLKIELSNLMKIGELNYFINILKIYRFYKFIKNHNYDIIHYHHGGISVLFLSRLFKKKAKLIHHIHSGNISGRLFQDSVPFVHKMVYRTLKNSTTQISVSKHIAEYYFKNVGHSNNMHLVENFSPDDFQKKNGIQKSIGYIGRISHDKSFNLFLNLIFNKNLEKYGINYFIQGDVYDNLKNELEPLISSGRVKYISPSFDIATFFNAIDIFIFPSTYKEGLPLVLLESACYDTPILGIKTIANKEVLGNYPLLLEEWSTKQAISLIKQLYKGVINKDKLSDLHKSISKKYCKNQSLKKLIEIYEN